MTRDKLIAAMRATAGIKPAAVPTKEWGTVYVRGLTVAEVEDQPEVPEGKSKHSIARGALRVICDESGNRIFDEANEDHVELLAAQPWALLRSLLAKADDINGLSEKGVEAAKKG